MDKIKILHLVKRYSGNYPLRNSMILGLDHDLFDAKACYLFGKPDGRNLLDQHGKAIYLDVDDTNKSAIRTILSLTKILKIEKPAILHCHRHKATVYGTIAARIAGVPVVVSHTHGTAIKRLRNLRRRIVNWFIYKWVNKVITVSQAEREDILITNQSLAPSKITTIWNGVDIEIFNIEPLGKDATRGKMGVFPGELVFGTMGRLVAKKGHSYLLEAFREVMNKIHNARLVIIGTGPLLEELKEKAQKLGISSKVSFMGYRKDGRELLSGFDVFVFPSFHEGLPLALLEAMASKLPVVISDGRGMPEVFGGGGFGKIVPSGDSKAFAEAMTEIASSPEEQRLEMGEVARERIEEAFTTEIMCETLMDVYKSVIKTPRL